MASPAAALAPCTTIVTSPFTRCVQTVKPLARARKLEIVKDKRLGEDVPTDAAVELVAELPSGAVVCSHGDVIGDLLGGLAAQPDATPGLAGRLRREKGSTWWLTLDGAQARAASYLPPLEST